MFLFLLLLFLHNLIIVTTTQLSGEKAINNSVRIHIDKKYCDYGGHFLHSGSNKRAAKFNTFCVIKEDCRNCMEAKDFSTALPVFAESSNTNLNKLDCSVLTANIDDITQIKLPQLLNQADESASVRKIIIHFRKPHSPRQIGAIIDEYLTPRPWWRVAKEPYDWHGASAELTVILDRYLISWENHWRYLISVQYPPPDVCARSSIVVGKNSCIHPGWFSVLAFYTLTHRQFPFAISTAYVPYLDDVEHQQSAFITITNPRKTALQRDCPTFNHSDLSGHFSDTWRCAFLPNTNCTLPLKVTSCRNSSCIMEQNTGFSLMLDSASPAGQVINSTLVDDYGKTALTATQLAYSNQQTPPPFYFTLPHNLTYARSYQKTKNRCMFSHVGSDSAAFMYAFLLRKSALYRSRVAKILHTFRNPPAGERRLNASASCVAVHLRRGDRIVHVPKNTNFTEYCYNTTHNLPCNGGHCDPDAGCGDDPRQPPFAAITLRHVLDKVPMLVGSGIRNVFVASDDSSWVEQQIREVRATDPSWNVFTLSAPKSKSSNSSSNSNSGGDKDKSKDKGKTVDPYLGDQEPYDGYFYMRSHGGTASGSYLMASMELVTQCEGFIGHMGCGGTMLHYQYMCIQHAGTRGVCPPIYDLRNGLDL